MESKLHNVIEFLRNQLYLGVFCFTKYARININTHIFGTLMMLDTYLSYCHAMEPNFRT